jgi:hypothetical protein
LNIEYSKKPSKTNGFRGYEGPNYRSLAIEYSKKPIKSNGFRGQMEGQNCRGGFAI